LANVPPLSFVPLRSSNGGAVVADIWLPGPGDEQKQWSVPILLAFVRLDIYSSDHGGPWDLDGNPPPPGSWSRKLAKAASRTTGEAGMPRLYAALHAAEGMDRLRCTTKRNRRFVANSRVPQHGWVTGMLAARCCCHQLPMRARVRWWPGSDLDVSLARVRVRLVVSIMRHAVLRTHMAPSASGNLNCRSPKARNEPLTC
jgi:hypothetical protein